MKGARLASKSSWSRFKSMENHRWWKGLELEVIADLRGDEVTGGVVGQWVSHAFPTCSSTHPHLNALWPMEGEHISIPTLCLSAEAVEEMRCLLKKQSSVLDQAIQNCSNSQRKQLFRNQCCLQDGWSKQEASSLGSRSSFLLRHMANKLWKHILSLVFVIQQVSVEFLLCASAAGAMHWKLKDHWELSVFDF